MSKKLLNELYSHTCEIHAYLETCVNVSVEVMWECEWQRLKKTNAELRTFLKRGSRHRPSYSKGPVTEARIIAAVLDESCFGLVECDISVPESLREQFEPSLTIFFKEPSLKISR